MKRYRLLKELPTFKVGDEFFISESGNLIAGTLGKSFAIAYTQKTLKQFPNILTDWFEEIEEFKIPDKFEMGFWTIFYGEDGFYTWYCPSDEFEDYGKKLKHHIEVGWAFEAEQEAKEYLEWLKARVVLLEDTKGFKPDWKDKNQMKWHVEYYNEHMDNKFYIYGDSVYQVSETIYFKRKKDAVNSIKNHEKEWKIYLGVEE